MAIIGVADPGSSRHKWPSIARSRIVNVTNQETKAVRKHQKFWDKKNKGYITPLDTVTGFMNLGYGMIFSLTVGTFMGVFLAYATQDSWIPDPRCRINVRKLSRPTKCPSPSRVYDESGHFNTEKFEKLFDKYAQSDLSGNTITLSELIQMASEQASYGASPTAWTMALFNWVGLYMLIGHHGSFHKQDIQAVYDGSLFYRIREARCASVQPASLDSSTGHLILPQNAIRLFEHHLNTAVDHLPQSTIAVMRSWIPPVDSMLGSNVVATPIQRRGNRRFNSNATNNERISGTKSISFNNKSFSLTGVQGYEDISSSSSTVSEGDRMLPDLISEETDSTTSSVGNTSIGVLTTGICPDGADYYRDTPYTNWIGRQLSGVQKGDYNDQQNNIPMAEISDECYQAQLCGVKSDIYISSPLTDWLVEDQHNNEEEKYIKKSGYMNQLEPVILTGVVQAPSSIVDHLTMDKDVSSYNENRNIQSRSYPVTLSGIRNDATPKNKAMNAIVPIVDAPIPVEKELNYALEPVSLSGVRCTSADDEKQDEVSRNGLVIVQAPTSFEYQEVDFESYRQPVALCGLSTYTQKISDGHQRGSSLVGVEAPSSLLYNNQDKKNVAMESVVLTGVSKVSSAVEMVSSNLPIIEASVPLKKVEENPVVFKHTALTGVSLSTYDDVSSSSTFTTVTTPSILETSPSCHSSFRLRSVDTEYTSSVKAPAVSETKKSSIALEPAVLTGLKTSNVLATSFVEAPTDYKHKKSVALETITLSGLRPKDVLTTGFVEEPIINKSKEYGAFEAAVLSGLSNDTAIASFVEEPTDYKLKKHVILERPYLSGIREQEQIYDVGFVELPSDLTIEKSYETEPVSLIGLSSDTTTASFVEEPIVEKKPVDLEEAAKPVSICGLSREQSYDDFVQAPIDYKQVQIVELEPAALSSLREDTAYLWGVIEPIEYKPKQSVVLETVSLSGVREEDKKWLADDTTLPYCKERRPSLEEPLEDSDIDLLFDWRKATHFEKSKINLDFVWKWRERTGFDVELPPIENVELCGVVSSNIEDAFVEDVPIVKDPGTDKPFSGMDFITTPVSLIGICSEEPQEKLKNHLNIGRLEGVTNEISTLYEEPIILSEPIKEHIDLEQYRRAFPLSGVHKKDTQERAIKNWLNSGALPGTIVSFDDSKLYEAPSKTIPEDYIAPPPKGDHDKVGVLAAGISKKKVKKPLKNWLNIKSVGSMYEPAQPEPEPKEMEIDLEVYRVPFPLNGLTDNEVQQKNWLNNGALPGVQAFSKSSYHDARDDIPSDYIQPRDSSLDEDKALEGVKITSDRSLRLKNWLSTSDLPGVEKEDSYRVYDDARELPPSEYIQPPLEDQEMPVDFKLTGVSAADAASEIGVPGLSGKAIHNDSEDEHSITTESTSPGPLSPEEYKDKKSVPTQKMGIENTNWSIMAEVTHQKEE